jgi:hypothetical protein
LKLLFKNRKKKRILFLENSYTKTKLMIIKKILAGGKRSLLNQFFVLSLLKDVHYFRLLTLVIVAVRVRRASSGATLSTRISRRGLTTRFRPFRMVSTVAIPRSVRFVMH